MGPRERLVGERLVPVLGIVRRVHELDAAASVMERRLGAAEHRVDVRALPFAPRGVDRRPHRDPVVARRMRGVEQLVVLRRRPRGSLHQLPGTVEEADRQLPLVHLRILSLAHDRLVH
jgi:hypothetical protein